MTKKELGYKYAQEENGHLAGQWPEPDDGGLADDPDFKTGYKQFHDELSQMP